MKIYYCSFLTNFSAEKIAKATGKKVTVIAGIHFDNVSEKEIETILNACKKLSEKIIEKLG